MRRYSDKTVKLAAKRVRRGVREMPQWNLSNRDQVEILVSQLAKQGLQPIDVARSNGAEAVIVIARAIQKPLEITVDHKTTSAPPTGTVVIDSFPFEYEPGRWLTMPRRCYSMPEISNTWQRVVDYATRMPEVPKP